MSLLDRAKTALSDFSIKDFFVDPPKPSLKAPDFEYFLIEETQGPKKSVYLRGNQLPMDSFGFGGAQRIKKDFYSGYSEPAVQVLGPTENDTIIKGVLKDKRFAEELEGASLELQKLIDSIRIRGNLCRFVLGEWERYGFIEETKFDLYKESFIKYELKLSIIGFTAPKNAKFLESPRDYPFDINEKLINQASKFIEDNLPAPDNLPFDIGRELNRLTGDVAAAIGKLTNFVDTVLDTVQDVQKAVTRAVGLVSYTRNKITNYINFAKSFNPLDFEASLASRYASSSYISAGVSSASAMYGTLNTLEARFDAIALSLPSARHAVMDGDTLQSISIKYFETSENWKKIYDYNNLSSTNLSSGTVLDIPRS